MILFVKNLINIKFFPTFAITSLFVLFLSGITYIEYGSSFIYLFYFTAALSILFFRIKRYFFKEYFLIISLLILSTLINFFTASFITAIFHLSLVTFAFVLASIDFPIIKSLRLVLWSYIFITLIAYLANVLNIIFLIDILDFAIDASEDEFRINAFATEPSYAAFLISLLWFSLAKNDLISSKETALVILCLLLLKSLYGLFLIFLILAQIIDLRIFFKFHKYLIFLIILIIYLIFFDTFLINKIESALIFSDSSFQLDVESGPAAVRFLPYVYMFNQEIESAYTMFGSGAGIFQNKFYNEYGYLFTEGDALSGHMAGVLFDYGLLFTLAIIYIFIKRFPAKKYVSYPYIILLFLNTGIGTYLFVIYLFLILRTKYDH